MYICIHIKNYNYLQELKTSLVPRKYLKEIVTQGIKKASIIHREALHFEKAKKNNQVLSFISTYNPNNPNLFSLITKTINMLQGGTSAKEAANANQQI